MLFRSQITFLLSGIIQYKGNDIWSVISPFMKEEITPITETLDDLTPIETIKEDVIKENTDKPVTDSKKKKKTKTVKYDYKVGKPQEETTTENEEIETMDGIVDRQGLKMLASALKDLNEILTNKQSNSESDISNVKEVLVKIKEVANNEQSN